MYASLVSYITSRFVGFIGGMVKMVQRGDIEFYLFDGSKIAITDADIEVVSREKWSPRSSPLIVVEVSDLDIDHSSISRNYALPNADNPLAMEYLGLVNGTVTISCMDTTEPSARYLTDIVALFFCTQQAFDFFNKYGIRIPDLPSYRGMDEIVPSGQDYKIFVGSLSQQFNAEWKFVTEPKIPIEQFWLTIEEELKGQVVIIETN